MLYTGIDLHKRFSYLTTVDENGKIVKESKIVNDSTKILSYFWSLKDEHKAVCENTIGWYWMVDLLQRHHIDITLANANKLKAIASAKVKTDRVDSNTMAQLLRLNFIPEAYVVDPKIRELRDLMRGRLRLVERRTATINSMHRLLEKFNVTDPDDLSDSYRLLFFQYHEHVQLMTQHIQHIEKTIKNQMILDDRIQKILWIPGIGKITAFTLILEIDNIQRFPTEGQFFSYARLVPGARDSGGKTRHNTRRSKAGNRYLKIAFNNAAVEAYKDYPVIRSFYQSKCRKKNKHLARTLVAKELARIVYHVVKEDVDYDFTFKGTPLEKVKSCCWPRPVSPRPLMV